MGPGSVSSQGDADVREATHIAREMIFTCGFSRGLGPVALMEPARLATPYSDDETAASTSQVGSAVARIALGEVDEVNSSGLHMSEECCRPPSLVSSWGLAVTSMMVLAHPMVAVGGSRLRLVTVCCPCWGSDAGDHTLCSMTVWWGLARPDRSLPCLV